MVQRYKLPTQKMNSKHYDRVGVDPFLYMQREGIGTAKKEKKRKKRARQCTCCFMPPALRYYVAIGTVSREQKNR